MGTRMPETHPCPTVCVCCASVWGDWRGFRCMRFLVPMVSPVPHAQCGKKAGTKATPLGQKKKTREKRPATSDRFLQTHPAGNAVCKRKKRNMRVRVFASSRHPFLFFFVWSIDIFCGICEVSAQKKGQAKSWTGMKKKKRIEGTVMCTVADTQCNCPFFPPAARSLFLAGKTFSSANPIGRQKYCPRWHESPHWAMGTIDIFCRLPKARSACVLSCRADAAACRQKQKKRTAGCGVCF